MTDVEMTAADADAWPSTKIIQSNLEKGELLLTPNMAARPPKGHSYVPVGEYAVFVEAYEERKRRPKVTARAMPPPKAKAPAKKKAAPKKVYQEEEYWPAEVYTPPVVQGPVIPQMPDLTGLTPEEAKAKKKEFKRMQREILLKQISAIQDAHKTLDEAEEEAKKKAEEKKAREDGRKRAAKPSQAHGQDFIVGEKASEKAVEKASKFEGKKTKKVPKKGKDGKIITMRDMKRDELMVDRKDRRVALIRKCREVLTLTRKNKDARIFAMPVDPMKMGLPDYFDIIKNPMDFGTVKQRLDSKAAGTAYDHPMEFYRDVTLTLDNCRLYNKADSVVGTMGESVRADFEKHWAAAELEAKAADEDEYRASEEAIIAAEPDDPVEEEVLEESKQVSEINRQLAEVQRQLEEFKRAHSEGTRMTPPSGGGGGGGGAKRKRPAADLEDDEYFMDEEEPDDVYIPAPRNRGGSRGGGGGASRSRGGGGGGGGGSRAPARAPASEPLPTRDMTYAEKQELTELLGELPEDKQAKVVQIVVERQKELGNAEGDLIEINIEELDSVTLWKLDRFARSCIKPKKKKPTQAEILLEAQRAEEEAQRELMEVEASLGVGVGAPAAPAAPSEPAAAPAPDKRASDSDATSSSSSDSGSSSSDSDSLDSAEGGGSNPKDGTAAAAAGAGVAPAPAPAGGASAVEVSSSRPVDEGLALKQNQSKQEVIIQNQAGWNNLADKPGDAAPAAGATNGETAAAGEKEAIPDSLWSDFEAMAQQKSDREKEREAEEEREKAAAVAKEEAAKEEEERKRRAAVEAEAAAKRAEEEAEAEKKRALEEARKKAREELDGMDQTVDIEAQREVMKEFDAQ